MKRNQPKSGLRWRSGSQIQPVRPGKGFVVPEPQSLRLASRAPWPLRSLRFLKFFEGTGSEFFLARASQTVH